MNIFRKKSNDTSNDYYNAYKAELGRAEEKKGFFSLNTIIKLETAVITAGLIFMGYNNFDEPVFVANYRSGVRVVPNSDMERFLEVMKPQSVERFNGSDNQRNIALERAESRIGERAYNYITNNCEHFKNWVHNGENYSSQVDNAGSAALVVGAGAVIGGLATKNKGVAALGLGALLLGAILKSSAKETK